MTSGFAAVAGILGRAGGPADVIGDVGVRRAGGIGGVAHDVVAVIDAGHLEILRQRPHVPQPVWVAAGLVAPGW